MSDCWIYDVYDWLRRFGDVLAAGGLVLSAVGLGVVIAIYRRQSRQAEKNQERLEGLIKNINLGVFVREHEKKTGKPASPETRAEFEASAGVAATILSEYIIFGTVPPEETGKSGDEV